MIATVDDEGSQLTHVITTERWPPFVSRCSPLIFVCLRIANTHTQLTSISHHACKSSGRITSLGGFNCRSTNIKCNFAMGVCAYWANDIAIQDATDFYHPFIRCFAMNSILISSGTFARDCLGRNRKSFVAVVNSSRRQTATKDSCHFVQFVNVYCEWVRSYEI